MTRARPDLDVGPIFGEMPDAPIDWPAEFGRVAPVELEVGPGKGLYLAYAARARPDRDFVGVEMARKYARLAAERLAKAGLTNVRVVAADARRYLSQFVPPASLAAVHVYFPDPWWKARHRKRRVFCDPFVVDVSRALSPGGLFHLATDVAEYFGVMTTLMSAHPEFEPEPIPVAIPAESADDSLTNFERKYRAEGRPIHRALFRFNPPGHR